MEMGHNLTLLPGSEHQHVSAHCLKVSSAVSPGGGGGGHCTLGDGQHSDNVIREVSNILYSVC